MFDWARPQTGDFYPQPKDFSSTHSMYVLDKLNVLGVIIVSCNTNNVVLLCYSEEQSKKWFWHLIPEKKTMIGWSALALGKLCDRLMADAQIIVLLSSTKHGSPFAFVCTRQYWYEEQVMSICHTFIGIFCHLCKSNFILETQANAPHMRTSTLHRDWVFFSVSDWSICSHWKTHCSCVWSMNSA